MATALSELTAGMKVRVAGKRGEYTLLRPATSKTGTTGWWAIGPNGSHRAIRDDAIKRRRR